MRNCIFLVLFIMSVGSVGVPLKGGETQLRVLYCARNIHAVLKQVFNEFIQNTNSYIYHLELLLWLQVHEKGILKI